MFFRDTVSREAITEHPVGAAAIVPMVVSTENPSPAAAAYLHEPAIAKLCEFFSAKGLAALKDEDGRELWYEDWLKYQAKHGLYASLLSPVRYAPKSGGIQVFRLARFLEVFGYFSPGHGYSLQVTFLGMFSILMGTNESLKAEAVEILEHGGLLGFGVSEKDHGADLIGNEFTIRENGQGTFVAEGRKYYIGNANCASMISILAKKVERRANGDSRRARMALIALRPAQARGYGNVRKIRTLGVRSAFVGEFEVKDHTLPASDIVAEGRAAWEAVLGTVTLGKFFLGFASIGICEHAFAEASAHLAKRVLYNKPLTDMPHIRRALCEAYVRLAAMKLYAYRALDYVQTATAEDRRYLMFNAVQKAKVSTEGVKVMGLLSECIGAKGFEADTHFEMALRDAQLIPGLEGSMHINLGMAAQFIPRYLGEPVEGLGEPGSLTMGDLTPAENGFLYEGRTNATQEVGFGDWMQSFEPLTIIDNVRLFVGQILAFSKVASEEPFVQVSPRDTHVSNGLGHCVALIAYGQLIAENARRVGTSTDMLSAIFHLLVRDLSAAAVTLGLTTEASATVKALLMVEMNRVPDAGLAAWESIASHAVNFEKRGD